MSERQRVLPFGDKVEFREDLDTGATSLVRKKRRKIPEATYIQRVRAINQWRGESNFELIFAAGAQAFPEAESSKIALRSGINTEWASNIGCRDDAESALSDMFDPQLTRFKPIRAVDIVRLMKAEAAKIDRKTNFHLHGLQAYLERTIVILGEARGLSEKTVENLIIFSRQQS